MQEAMDSSQRFSGKIPLCFPSHHHHSHHHYHRCLLKNGCLCRRPCLAPCSRCLHHHCLHHHHCINRHLHYHNLYPHNPNFFFLPHNPEPIVSASLLNGVTFEDSGCKEHQLSSAQSVPEEENTLVEEAEEEPIFVLTDEWREFFGKAEARRLEKKQAKKNTKLLDQNPNRLSGSINGGYCSK